MSRCSCSAERRALQDAFAHIALASDVDLVFEEIPQRAADRIKALLAVAALDCAVVDVVPKLNIGIERTRRLAPALASVKAKLGGEHVADDQRFAVETVWRERAELVLPQPDQPARSHLQRDETKWRDGIALYTPIGQARAGIEFGIDDPDFPERQLGANQRSSSSASCRAAGPRPSDRGRSDVLCPG